MAKRIVVKVGSNVLTDNEGMLDISYMSSLVNQIVEIRSMGIEVILVSSGAVASGRSEIKPKVKLDIVSSRQLFSAVGQVKLINHYYDLFNKKDIVCGQILTTKEDFSTRNHYLNQRNCINVMLENGVLPIINENDTISVNELMFTDNDELSGLVATMTNSKTLIILSNIDGIYNGDPKDSNSEVIKVISPDKDISQYIQDAKSSHGRGGMKSKHSIAKKVANEGVEVIIANGKKENILVDIINNKDITYTRFLSSINNVSSVKKWISHSESFAKGELYVNEGAKQVLISNKAVSLLAVGVTKIKGEFEVNDIIKIMDEEGNQLGVGCISYNSKEIEQYLGKANVKPLVHYNYLYILQN